MLCPWCGKPAMTHRTWWECYYCGDSGNLRRVTRPTPPAEENASKPTLPIPIRRGCCATFPKRSARGASGSLWAWARWRSSSAPTARTARQASPCEGRCCARREAACRQKEKSDGERRSEEEGVRRQEGKKHLQPPLSQRDSYKCSLLYGTFLCRWQIPLESKIFHADR